MSTSAQDIVAEAKLNSNEPKDITQWTKQLVENLVLQLNNGVPRLRWAMLNVGLTKPREGDIVLADGTNFNPTGSGVKGFYGYYAGAWHFLG